MTLSKDQIARYGRQLILPEIGVAGQQKLADAAVLVVGAGGLGCPSALYLAAAGVGRLGLVDHDAVALNNLHRQILHTTASIGRPKSESAAERLRALNPGIEIQAIGERLTVANVRRLIAPYGVILDGSDNFATRYLVNDACILSGKPLVHGGVVRFGGQVMTIHPRRSACYRCVFPEPPGPGAIPSCQDAGVIGTAAGLIGVLMAHEALKLVTGFGEPLADRLLTVEGRASRFREVPVRRNPECAVCGEHPTHQDIVAVDDAVCLNAQPQEDPWPASR